MALTKVSTDGVKDDAVNFNKIGHIDSGRILGRVSGGLGQIETPNASQVRTLLNVADGANQTTINNNADNRVITGSGTANTLNGETNFSYDGTKCLIGTSTGAPFVNRNLTVAQGGSNNTTVAIEVRSPTNGDGRLIFTDSTSSSDTGSYKGQIMYDQSNDFMQFGVNGASEAMRIVSNKEVGINIINPETYGLNGHGYGGLTVQAPSGNNSGITIRSNYAGAGMLAFSDGNGSAAERMNGFISCDHVNKRLNIGLDNNTVARITEHGFTPNPSDTAAANALDDYEEGTWSPQIYYQNSGDQNDSNNLASYGWYQKVGNVIHVSFFLRWTLTGSAANDNIGVKNFPFVQSPVTSTYGDAGGIGSVSHSGTSLNATDCIVLKSAGSGSTLMYLEDIGSQGNRGNEFGANSGMRVWGSVTYRTT